MLYGAVKTTQLYSTIDETKIIPNNVMYLNLSNQIIEPIK